MTEENFENEMFEDNADALTLDDLTSGFIKNPAVGDAPTEFVVKKVSKLTGKNTIGKTREGETFSKTLSSVDYGYEITTQSGERYNISSWEVFGKLKSIFQKLQKIDGVEIQLTHLLDGMKAENKKKDKYKVAAKVDGEYKSLNRESKEWE